MLTHRVLYIYPALNPYHPQKSCLNKQKKKFFKKVLVYMFVWPREKWNLVAGAASMTVLVCAYSCSSSLRRGDTREPRHSAIRIANAPKEERGPHTREIVKAFSLSLSGSCYNVTQWEPRSSVCLMMVRHLAFPHTASQGHNKEYEILWLCRLFYVCVCVVCSLPL